MKRADQASSDVSSLQEALEPMAPAIIGTLVDNHRQFLRFLERRTATRAQAEEILQNAFVKTLEAKTQPQDDESAITWFYRLLRNALIDHYRRSSVEQRALEQQASQVALDESEEGEVKGIICSCMKSLIKTLKPDYAEIIEQVDLNEQSVSAVAASQGITSNNGMVRLHRARRALKHQLEQSCGSCAIHGCLDCSCQGK